MTKLKWWKELIITWMKRQKRRFKQKAKEKLRKIREPKPDVLYFAYGSNMSSMRLADRIRSFRRIGAYKLEGYKLVYNAGRKIAFANVEKSEGDHVNGVLYRMEYKNMCRLDGYEALYNRESVIDEKHEFPIQFYISKCITDAPTTLEYLHHIKIGIMENDLPFGQAYRDAKIKIIEEKEYKGEMHYGEEEHI